MAPTSSLEWFTSFIGTMSSEIMQRFTSPSGGRQPVGQSNDTIPQNDTAPEEEVVDPATLNHRLMKDVFNDT